MGKGVFKARVGKKDVVIGDGVPENEKIATSPPPGAKVTTPTPGIGQNSMNASSGKLNPPSLPPRSKSPTSSLNPNIQSPPPYTPSPGHGPRPTAPRLPPRGDNKA